jgi:hypothetical protein
MIHFALLPHVDHTAAYLRLDCRKQVSVRTNAATNTRSHIDTVDQFINNLLTIFGSLSIFEKEKHPNV